VLAALVDNAIKFSQEGGSIAISAEEQPGLVIFNIDDEGIGIPAEAMQDIFEPFGRGTSVQDYNYEGAGLSLFLCKLIMEHLGGDIDLQSNSQGTHARLHIPMRF
jgi:signal transduction histidine kinase